ncbi:MAG: long-chain-fatty-acid--CoA ligase [Sphingomonas bacterium]|nr:long-chain-fatty-acid--CoA ligase [Sphingomonas bacterium]
MDSAVQDRRAAIARRHPRWDEMTLDAYLDRAAIDFARHPLVLTDDVTLSYGDVVDQSRRIAAGFAALGIGAGDRVGIVMANHPVTVPLLFAVWRIGAVAVPMNTLYRPEELEYAIREADCALLVVMERFGSRSYVADLDARVPGWRDGRNATLPTLRHALLYDDRDPTAFLDNLAVGNDVALSSADPHDAAVIMFTSGTTGSPKGVIQTHDNILRAAYAGAYHQAFEEGRRAVFSLPLYHAFGLVVGLLSGLVTGGSIVPLLKFDPDAILRAIARHKATFLMGVPTMTIALMEQAKTQDYDLASLTAIHSAAAPTPSWVWRDIQQTLGCDEIFTSYGQTETTATIVCTQPSDPIDIVSSTQGTIVEAGVAGIAHAGGRIAEFKTIDPETLEELPWGEAGELCTRGPMNSKGYFRRPEETAKIMLPGGWLRTGDLGRFLPDGNLFLTGRSKELYKSRGELVSPKELEQLLTSHPAISQAFLIGMPDDRWGEIGCAWIVRNDGHTIEAEAVIAFLAERVARYKLPRDVWFIDVEELPKTGTGKVQKNLLKVLAERLLGETADLIQ